MRRLSVRLAGVALASAGLILPSIATAADSSTATTAATTAATAASAAMEAAAASAAASAPRLLQPLPLRRDADEPGFPVAGAVFLLLLVLASVAAWWHRRRQGGLTLPGLSARLTSTPTSDLRVTAGLRLDVHTRLHVVEWEGRKLLLAVGGTAAPVVIDRIDPAPQPETAP
ncbi:hypothetical protein CDL60_12895 [Roseateles noduli]|nr:hypothetical protein CDL60_12895 [Roseateles noduli]